MDGRNGHTHTHTYSQIITLHIKSQDTHAHQMKCELFRTFSNKQNRKKHYYGEILNGIIIVHLKQLDLWHLYDYNKLRKTNNCKMDVDEVHGCTLCTYLPFIALPFHPWPICCIACLQLFALSVVCAITI